MKARNLLRFRQSKGKSIDVTRNPFLTQLQCYWLTSDSVKVEGFDFNAYRIRLNPNNIIVDYKELEDSIIRCIPKAVCYTDKYQKEEEDLEDEPITYEYIMEQERQKRFEKYLKGYKGK